MDNGKPLFFIGMLRLAIILLVVIDFLTTRKYLLSERRYQTTAKSHIEKEKQPATLS